MADQGLLAWYRYDLGEFVDTVMLGNKYIRSKSGQNITFGTYFTEEDFNIS